MLVLWDIDGTLLLRAADAHRDAILAALRRVHRVDVAEAGVETAGRTDGAICRAILINAGVPADRIDAAMDQVRRVSIEEFARRVPDDLTHTVAPGVEDALAELAAREGTRNALLTGNFEPIARLKLLRAGIARWFPPGQGAFGSDHDDRAALPALARRRAGRAHEPWPREGTVVIGDTPRDIACARADGVRVVAVATGPYEAGALLGADAVCGSAAEVPAALATL